LPLAAEEVSMRNFLTAPFVLAAPLAVLMSGFIETSASIAGDQEKIERRLAEPPQQQGKERELLGQVSLSAPDEGHYDCSTASPSSDGNDETVSQIGSDDEHTGFDLFADGAYRLKKKDGTFEKDGSSFRHNPANGALVFDQGTLSVYLKQALHVRKKVSEALPDVSIVYQAEYAYDGALKELIVCGFEGPPGSKSPNAESAERAQKNLNPPPPGETRLNGLFYRLTWLAMTGPNFTPYMKDHYDYLYFQDNGYVWLREPPEDGDFEKLGCNKPMVDRTGEASCTTYAISDGLFSKPAIAIGLETPVAFEENDGGVSVNGREYLRLMPADDLKLDGSYKYFSFNGMVASNGQYRFTSDGKYEASAGVGIVYTTPEIQGSETTVTGYKSDGKTAGEYSINNYTIELTSQQGGIARKFFSQFDARMIMVGRQPLVEKSD
jgi:hypothetical protein